MPSPGFVAPTARLEEFLASESPETPFVVVDLDVVRERYLELVETLPDTTVFYAVKANPAAPIVELLVDLGASFDVASPAELSVCLAAGADPERISYGNTVKKISWIEDAYEKGVRNFAFDSEQELDKIVAAAPGSTVCCRILCDNHGADWPLTRKFGCEPSMAGKLLIQAADAGLDLGVAFHVGSQQRDVDAWSHPLAVVADIDAMLRAHGVGLSILNIGGGFPGHYLDEVPAMRAYGDAIAAALREHFGDRMPFVIVEPGRSLVADAGVLRSEVLLVARKGEYDPQRWVFLDVGLFSGLAETMGEAIRYRLRTPYDDDATSKRGPVVLAGPTCDSVDVMYEHYAYELPLALAPGDHVDILAAGAYTTTYSTVGFNGFPPLIAHYLPAT